MFKAREWNVMLLNQYKDFFYNFVIIYIFIPFHTDFAASSFRQYERLTKQMKPSEVGDEYERTKQRMYEQTLCFKMFSLNKIGLFNRKNLYLSCQGISMFPGICTLFCIDPDYSWKSTLFNKLWHTSSRIPASFSSILCSFHCYPKQGGGVTDIFLEKSIVNA